MFKPHRFVPKTAVAAALAATGMAAHATTPFVVQDIRIDGLQRIEPGSVFAYLPIKQGDTFTDDKASEAIRALYATGFFNDVQIATQGNVVVVQVQERPAISQIDFAGLHEFDKENLTKALRSVGLSQGRSYDKALVDQRRAGTQAPVPHARLSTRPK